MATLVYGNGSCAACGAHTKVGNLMCATHWVLVPAAQRSAVYNALRAWDRSEGTLQELRAAQAAAVASVIGVPQEPTLEGSEDAETDKHYAEFYDRLEE